MANKKNPMGLVYIDIKDNRRELYPGTNIVAFLGIEKKAMLIQHSTGGAVYLIPFKTFSLIVPVFDSHGIDFEVKSKHLIQLPVISEA